MRLQGIFLCLVLAGSLNSCDRTSVGQIGEITSIDLSEIVPDTSYWDISQAFEDLSLIKLGDESSIVLGNIHGVSHFTSGFIVNVERGSFLFDTSGVYKRDYIKYGRGPEEFLNGIVLCFLKDTAGVIEDLHKSRDFYYTVNIENSAIGRIKKASSGRISSLIPLSDTTLAALTDDMLVGRGMELNFSLVQQKIDGELISNCNLGSDMGNFLGPGTILNSGVGIVVSLPSGKYFFGVNSDNLIDTIWETRGLNWPPSPISPGAYDQLAPGHIDQEKLLIFKRKVVVGHMVTKFTDWELLLINKKTGAVTVLKPYLLDELMQLNISKGDFTSDGYFCKVLYPKFLMQITTLPGGVNFLNSMNKSSRAGLEKLSLEDNPYLLYGRLK